MNLDGEFFNLKPELVLSVAEETLLTRATGRLTPLNSFENRAYIVELEDSQKSEVVVKCYRPGRWSKNALLEEHSFLEQLETNEIPVVSPLRDQSHSSLINKEGLYFSVFPKVSGRVKQELNLEELAQLSRLLGRIHKMGAAYTSQHRINFDPEDMGYKIIHFIENAAFCPLHLENTFFDVLYDSLEKAQETFDRTNIIEQRIHGDLHHSNLLWHNDQLKIFDFDDFGIGSRVQDFWMLLANTQAHEKESLNTLKHNYSLFNDFPDKEMHLIRELKILRQIKYCAWIAARWKDPAFPKAFYYFQEENYYHQLIRELQKYLNE